jgi:hypothetical protein
LLKDASDHGSSAAFSQATSRNGFPILEGDFGGPVVIAFRQSWLEKVAT